jgi:F0F1-type ATP synthase membrane subunit b/b'
MNTKNIIPVVIIVLLIIIALGVIKQNETPKNDLSKSLDNASENIEEGVNDAKRDIKDALD